MSHPQIVPMTITAEQLARLKELARQDATPAAQARRAFAAHIPPITALRPSTGKNPPLSGQGRTSPNAQPRKNSP